MWAMDGLDDRIGENSRLRAWGNVSFLSLTGEEREASRVRGGDGKVAVFHGGWFDAGQGAHEEVNLSGKNISIMVRFKADHVDGYTPIVAKAGNDQNIAYRVVLDRENEDRFIEAMIGSDDIAGAHALRYRLSEEECLLWHDVILCFDGRVSRLYVDGRLVDDEVTVGEIRDWNRRPLLIGAQYEEGMGYSADVDARAEYLFEGAIDHVALWNRCLSDREIMGYSGVEELTDGRPAYYTEVYRPQFHFSTKKNWLNDPNGLVYYDGVYHLFFQYMPPHRPGAYKDWGHAISRDLIHWEQTANHITPHKVWGGCWSGSAVVDERNVAGFQRGEEKTIVAFITNGGHPDRGVGPLCTQCVAYSTDGGHTFTYYDKNPVIANIHRSNRDPKVVWDKDSRQWVMSLYMDNGSEYGLFTSRDLKDWKQVSSMTLEGDAECPGFIPLLLDGDSARQKWLLFGAKGIYQVGSFDGKVFKPETKTLRMDYGKNFYAAMTWNNVPDNRCLHIAWMPTRRYPGMPYEQQMNFPTELSLRTTPDGPRVFRVPVREIEYLYDKAYTWNKRELPAGENLLADLDHDLYDMRFEVIPGMSSFDIMVRGARIHYDANQKRISCEGPTVEDSCVDLGEAPLEPKTGKVSLRVLVDRTSVEVFGNDGEVVITSNFMPDIENRHYSFILEKDLWIENIEIHSLKSAWPVGDNE